MPPCLGYIVQVRDEEDYTPYRGFLRIHRHFSAAVQHAQELYRSYLELHQEAYDGPFEVQTPTKKQCDDAGSVLVFRSRDCWIWIDGVVE